MRHTLGRQVLMNIGIAGWMLSSAKAVDLGLLDQQIANLKAAFPCENVEMTPADEAG